MQRRQLGRTGRHVAEIGLGAWQLGADWGDIDDAAAMAVLEAALDAGVTFIDTADVYGDGRSERLIGELLRAHPDAGLTVATKMGRRAPLDPVHYTLDSFRRWTDRSRANLGVDTLDLVQLHTPPTPVFSSDDVYDALDTLVADGVTAAYGVSVETAAEGLTAVRRPGVATVQVVFNALRRKPAEELLPAAAAAGVGIIVRVPLASGLLAGRYTEHTTFGPDDHRTYNRHGEVFDAGETFAGVDFATGVRAVDRLRPVVPEGATMAQFALRWILMDQAVSVVIPGARDPEQVRGNVAAAALPELDRSAMQLVRTVYDEDIRPLVHDRW
jgi:aryl-alcohol dehydrogenase-like predicted oxidoreductase